MKDDKKMDSDLQREDVSKRPGLRAYRDIKAMDSRNRVAIPACLCRKLGLKPGDGFTFSYDISDGDPVIIIKRDSAWQDALEPKQSGRKKAKP